MTGDVIKNVCYVSSFDLSNFNSHLQFEPSTRHFFKNFDNDITNNDVINFEINLFNLNSKPTFIHNLALLQLLDWLLDSKGSLTLDGRLERPKKGEVPHPKHRDFFLVAQDMVLSHRAKLQLIINFFRVKAISNGLVVIFVEKL